MAITNFIPQIWAAAILEALRQNLVFGGPGVVNRDYEGDIAQMGDTVHITSFGDPTITTYTAGTTLTYETLVDAGQTLLIDRGKSFSFKVDDINKRQARGDMITQMSSRAAYKLALEVENFIAGLYTGTDAANAITTTAITTGDLAYTNLLNLGVKLDEANVPLQNRYVIVPPWYYALLLNNDKFARVDASGTSAGLREGMVGRIDGFDVYKSNSCINVTGDDYIVQAGVPMAITLADQITETEALRLQTTFADAVRGLHLYGAKLVRSDCLATLIASKT